MCARDYNDVHYRALMWRDRTEYAIGEVGNKTFVVRIFETKAASVNVKRCVLPAAPITNVKHLSLFD